MTIEEKARMIDEYCDSRKLCCDGDDECPLFNLETECSDPNCPEDIEKNYEVLFPSGTQAPINNVNHPSHYNQGGIECIDAMVAAYGKEAVENFCLCNAFKYVWRNRDKNGFEDIDKAIWYLNKIKELCSND